MHITQLNWECLLHIFSFLDKNSRKSLAQTCHQLLRVFQDPLLWPLLYFQSPAELTKGNFVLGPALHYLSISWHSSRVKVCNIEDWMKSTFQRDICSTHEHIVNDFLLQVCNSLPLRTNSRSSWIGCAGKQPSLSLDLLQELKHTREAVSKADKVQESRPRPFRDFLHRCPNLLSLTLSGCGHVTDDYLTLLLKSCPCLRTLQLENCVQITDQTLEAVALYADCLQTLHVDFCRNITQAGLQRIQKTRPSITLKAERSANMIPDKKPGTIWASERALKKLLWH